MADWLITTFDNPWSPFTHPREWAAYDDLMGYKTIETVQRISSSNSMLSDELNEKLDDEAMNELIRTNPFLWTKIYENENVKRISIEEITNCLTAN